MNILFFGPNGSGKGTQGAILREKYKVAHIESGGIFRENIKGGTELGKKARERSKKYDWKSLAKDAEDLYDKIQ